MIDNPGETIAGFRTCQALSRFARNRRDPRQKSWKRSHGRSGSGGRAGASEASTRPGEAVQAEETEAAMVARSAAGPGDRSRGAELVAVERRR